MRNADLVRSALVFWGSSDKSLRCMTAAAFAEPCRCNDVAGHGHTLGFANPEHSAGVSPFDSCRLLPFGYALGVTNRHVVLVRHLHLLGLVTRYRNLLGNHLRHINRSAHGSHHGATTRNHTRELCAVLLTQQPASRHTVFMTVTGTLRQVVR